MLRNLFISLLLVFSLISSSIAQQKNLQLTPQGCIAVASILAETAEGRDNGVPGKVVLEELKKADLPDEVKLFIANEIYKVYTSSKNLTPDQVGILFTQRCYKAEGHLDRINEPQI